MSRTLRLRSPRITVLCLQGEGRQRIERPGTSPFFAPLVGQESVRPERSSGTSMLRRYSSGVSSSSCVGSIPLQMRSRVCRSRSARICDQNELASRDIRGETSRPKSEEKSCWAGEEVARLRRRVSLSAFREGNRSAAASVVTSSAHPSIRASAVSNFVSAATCSGLSSGVNKP